MVCSKSCPPSRIWTSDLEISDFVSDLQSPALPTELSVVMSQGEKERQDTHFFICTVSVVPIDHDISGGIAQVVSRGFCIQEEPGSIPMRSSFLRLWLLSPHELAGGLAQVVERSICIREAPGSIPGFSTFHRKVENSSYQTLSGVFLLFVLNVWLKYHIIMYHCFHKTAETRDWTRDLQIFSLTLSQLSYLGCATWALDFRAMAMYHSNTHIIHSLMRISLHHCLRSRRCSNSMAKLL